MTPYELDELTNYASDLRKDRGVFAYGDELTKLPRSYLRRSGGLFR